MSQEHLASNKRIGSQYEQYLMPIGKNLNVPIKRAPGCTVEDFDGNEYVDVFSGISVINAGHTNNVIPDSLAQATGVANGLPLGAFTASAEVTDSFEAGDHRSMFRGNPVACAAALATIEELEDGIVANAREQLQRTVETLDDAIAAGTSRGDSDP